MNEEGGSVFIQIFVTISYSLIGTIVALKEYYSSALISNVLSEFPMLVPSLLLITRVCAVAIVIKMHITTDRNIFSTTSPMYSLLPLPSLDLFFR